MIKINIYKALVFVSLILILSSCSSNSSGLTAMQQVRANATKWLAVNGEYGTKSPYQNIYNSIKNKDYDTAIQEANVMQVQHPKYTQPYFLLGIAHLYKGEPLLAIDYFSSTISLDKTRGDAHYYRAISYLNAGKTQDALKEIDIAIYTPKVSSQITDIFKALGVPNTSESFASSMLFDLRGMMYFLEQEYTLAYEDFQKAIEFYQDNKRSWNMIGVIDIFTGNYDKALQNTQLSSENRSIAYWLSKQKQEAVEVMQQAIAIKPHSNSYYHLAYFFHSLGRETQALETFKKAHKLDPNILNARANIIIKVPSSSPTRKFYQEEYEVATAYIETGKSPMSEHKMTTTPSLSITELQFDPKSVPLNKPFDIKISIEANTPSQKEKLDVLFYFTITQDNEVLYTSDTTTLKATNGLSETFNAHMDAVPVSGEYMLKAFIKYGKLSNEKSVKLTIK